MLARAFASVSAVTSPGRTGRPASSIRSSIATRSAGNAGDGVRIDVSEDSELTNLLIGNATGPNQTFDVNGELVGGGTVEQQAGDGNVITNNGGNGITIFRLSSAYVKGIKILDNIVTGNAEGIFLQASNTYQTVADRRPSSLKVVTDFTINTNDISNNRDQRRPSANGTQRRAARRHALQPHRWKCC